MPDPVPVPVTIDGRQFAVGDAVLTQWGAGRWVTGTICRIKLDDVFAIKVRDTNGVVWPCLPSEVHSIRENFA
jgi:acetamidase/formamidase